MKKYSLHLITLICTLSLMTGCQSVSKSYAQAAKVAAAKSRATFNRDAVYQIPPEGAWLADLVDMTTGTRQGPIYVPPGSIIYYDSELIDGSENKGDE